MRSSTAMTARIAALSSPAIATRRWLQPLLIVCGLCLLCDAAAAAAKEPAPAKAAAKSEATPSAFELQLLYADRTWNWKDGAAYFGSDRRLQAWTGGQDSPAVGEGRWLVTENGKMCMELAWRSKTYSTKPRRTCYSHRVEKGNIEQRKDPDGTWYDFKHAKDDPADEHQKFEAGNTKGAQFDETRKLVDSKS